MWYNFGMKHTVKGSSGVWSDFFTKAGKPIHFTIRRIAVVYALLGAFGALLFLKGMLVLVVASSDPFAPVVMTLGGMLLLGSALLISIELEEKK